MSLSVSIPAPVAPDGGPVAADAFLPAVAPDAVRAAMRLGTTVAPARLRAAIVAAIATAARDLDAWRIEQIASGHDTLASVPAPAIDGVSAKVQAWQRAVMSYAAADLAETHAEISATADGLQRAGEVAIPVDQHRRNALHAIRDIIGKRRARVALI